MKRRETAKDLLKKSTMEFINFRKMTQRLDKFTAHFSDMDNNHQYEIREAENSVYEASPEPRKYQFDDSTSSIASTP